MNPQPSPRLQARIAGAAYLVVIIAGMFAEAVARGTIIVPGDAAATTTNMVAHQQLFRWGFVANIVLLAFNVVLALIYFDLFKVVNRSVAAMVACFILLGTAIEGINLLHHIGPLSMLDSAAYARAFSSEQLQAQAYLDVELQTIGFNISLVFFGVYCVLAGYLIIRSTFLPRVLGVLLAVAGLCYLTNAFLTFLVPAFAADLLPYILVPSFIGEASLSLWLLVRGVDSARWLQQAQAHDRPLPSASAVPA